MDPHSWRLTQPQMLCVAKIYGWFTLTESETDSRFRHQAHTTRLSVQNTSTQFRARHSRCRSLTRVSVSVNTPQYNGYKTNTVATNMTDICFKRDLARTSALVNVHLSAYLHTLRHILAQKFQKSTILYNYMFVRKDEIVMILYRDRSCNGHTTMTHHMTMTQRLRGFWGSISFSSPIQDLNGKHVEIP